MTKKHDIDLNSENPTGKPQEKLWKQHLHVGFGMIVIIGIGYIMAGGLASSVEKLKSEFEKQRAHATAMCMVESSANATDCYCDTAKQLSQNTFLAPRVRAYPDEARLEFSALVQETVQSHCSQ